MEEGVEQGRVEGREMGERKKKKQRGMAVLEQGSEEEELERGMRGEGQRGRQSRFAGENGLSGGKTGSKTGREQKKKSRVEKA
jgi:hypothetical protein